MKMKNIAPVIVALALFGACDTVTKKDLLKTQERIYEKSLENNDVAAAITAAYTIMELDTTKVGYGDSLAHLYFIAGNYAAAYKLAERSRDTVSVVIKKISAYAAFRTGNYAGASLHFQDLLKADKDNAVIYDYEIAICFFNLENYETALNQLQKVISTPASRSTIKEVSTEEGSQRVPYHAVASNTAGYIFIAMNQLDKAEPIFTNLLKEYPDFILAQNNMQLLQQLKQQKK